MRIVWVVTASNLLVTHPRPHTHRLKLNRFNLFGHVFQQHIYYTNFLIEIFWNCVCGLIQPTSEQTFDWTQMNYRWMNTMSTMDWHNFQTESLIWIWLNFEGILLWHFTTCINCDYTHSNRDGQMCSAHSIISRHILT